jgi:hypothetical protein
VLEHLIDEKLVDYIAMDLKTDRVLYQPYIKPDCGPDPILASIRILMGKGTSYIPFVNQKVMIFIYL